MNIRSCAILLISLDQYVKYDIEIKQFLKAWE